jgi:molybdate transport system ATP-binding protein
MGIGTYFRGMATPFLVLTQVSVSPGGVVALDRLDWTIHRGEQWAITGPSGSGKTLLAHTLAGRHFYKGKIQYYFGEDGSLGEGGNASRIAMVEQQHRFRSRPGTTDLYYQQRFNSSDADQTITVEQELAEYAGWPGDDGAKKDRGTGTGGAEKAMAWLDLLHIRPLLTKPLIQLSNGENKRVQLAIALLGEPDLLILDNPFLGLDTEGRATLHQIIDGLADSGMQILLITGAQEIPASITHLGRLDKGKWSWLGPRAGFNPRPEARLSIRLDRAILDKLRGQAAGARKMAEEAMRGGAGTAQTAGDDFTIAVKMVGTTIRYGDAIILNDINWEVKKGEKWSVSGPNGAGKSTLLSLITADNPQAYANEVWLFDRRRGSGESIWDIKKNIGFVSPELHLYFDYSAGCFEVIASGLFDTIGLFRALTPEQEEVTLLWMRLLSLEELRYKRLAQLSTGQQRMVLLARALIKNPPMLILDEPCQGLDDEQTADFRGLIDILCEAFDTTLLYVSHYRQELPACIDHFLQLDKGVVLAIT